MTPYSRSICFLLLLVGAGFVAIGLAWRVVARSLVLGIQLPALVSGGLGGLGLLMVASVFAVVQVGRRADAEQAQRLEVVLDEAARVLAAATASTSLTAPGDSA